MCVKRSSNKTSNITLYVVQLSTKKEPTLSSAACMPTTHFDAWCKACNRPYFIIKTRQEVY